MCRRVLAREQAGQYFLKPGLSTADSFFDLETHQFLAAVQHNIAGVQILRNATWVRLIKVE